jgi:hypothetical protein
MNLSAVWVVGDGVWFKRVMGVEVKAVRAG